MNDFEIVSHILALNTIANYGTFERDLLAQSCKVSSSQIGALARLGLVDVSINQIYGITNASNVYYTFNDRWRLAKKLGSFNDLLIYETAKQEKQQEKEQLEFDLIQSQKKFQDLNNAFIARQTELIDNQIATNTNTVDTNRRTKWILWATVIVSAAGALASITTVVSDDGKTTILKRSNIQDSTIHSLNNRVNELHNNIIFLNKPLQAEKNKQLK